MNIFVTGGCGFIGSHTSLELLNSGHNVTVLDNLHNSQQKVINIVEQLSAKKISFIKGDIRDQDLLEGLFTKNKYDAVIHFAGLKAVGESVEKPLEYYDNNVTGTVNLLNAMKNNGIFNFVFSSSATVYANSENTPFKESEPTSAINPYGRSKVIIEEILKDLCTSDSRFNVIALRYFNPVGAHPSGKIGESPNGIPNNLFPIILQKITNPTNKLKIFGNDYDTTDGTAIRDYIHVVDLAKGHLKALEYLNSTPHFEAINLGTGNGYSVLDIVNMFTEVKGATVEYEIDQRRAGDNAISLADVKLAQKKLNWQAELNLKDMVRDSLNFNKSK